MGTVKKSFCAFIPFQIDDSDYPHLKGFPLNILYATDITIGKSVYSKSSLYIPDVSTFRETDFEKKLDYFDEHGGEFWVRVTYFKKKKSWQTEKYNGFKLLRVAEALDFKNLMIHTTMSGVDEELFDD